MARVPVSDVNILNMICYVMAHGIHRGTVHQSYPFIAQALVYLEELGNVAAQFLRSGYFLKLVVSQDPGDAARDLQRSANSKGLEKLVRA